MRELWVACVLAASGFAQAGNLGSFAHSGDIGDPSLKGAAEFDASTGQYKITGSGANIWAKQDQFQYVWREMAGDFTVTATIRFLGQGAEHRKAGIMVRQSLDNDAAYADVVIHGNGMPRFNGGANRAKTPTHSTHLHHQGIQEQDWVEWLQRPRLPPLYFFQHRIRHLRDQ
jgi:hypothetical protein